MEAMLFAVLLSVMQAAPPVPRQTPDSANQTADKREKEAGQHQGPIVQTPPPKPLTEKTVSEKAPPDNPASPNTQQPIRIAEVPPVSVTRDWMDKTGWAFGAILVGVGIVGVCAAYRTLRAIERQARIMRRQTAHIARQAVSMRRQTTILRESAAATRTAAEATEKSVKLQEAAMRQWIRLADWTHTVVHHKEGDVSLTVRFTLTNPTPYPIRLLSYNSTLGPIVSATAMPEHTLIPQEPFWVDTGTLLTPEQVKRRDTDGLVLAIAGTISFKDALQSNQEQKFLGLLLCGKGGRTTYTPQASRISGGDKED